MSRRDLLWAAAVIGSLLIACAERDNRFDPQSPLYRPAAPLLSTNFTYDSSRVRYVNGDTLGVVVPFTLVANASASVAGQSASAPGLHCYHYHGDSLVEFTTGKPELSFEFRDSGIHRVIFEAVTEERVAAAETLFVVAVLPPRSRIVHFRSSRDTLPVGAPQYSTFTVQISDSARVADSLYYIFSPVSYVARAVTRPSPGEFIYDTLRHALNSRVEGTQLIRLQVRDSLGRTDSASVLICFQQQYAGVAPRITSLAARPNPVALGQYVDFSVTASDPDGAIVRYMWLFGDGYSSSIREPRHRYVLPGQYLARIQVYDDSGASVSDSLTVKVESAANKPPVITRLSLRPNSGIAPLLVTFSAEAYDTDGVVERFSWDFGDGIDISGRDQSVSHMFYRAGLYPIRLIVRDDDYARDTAWDTVVVTNENPLPYGLYARPNPALTAETVLFWVTGVDTALSNLEFTWFFPGDTVITEVNHTYKSFSEPGIYTIRVGVSSPDSAPLLFTMLVKINGQTAVKPE